ncbi:uncharacterized protein LOC127854054 [Dreissena polymorpha]|uniref:Secreted protein n=1 Tax=Dreissena polymorpha TaxID=45954 RepID=A0A9D4N8U4_DREPO|nr:uncharacterized protein LOC127854054 [Dreissena polymorpha]KAH3891170.1 hypothetical protein DPMN_015259 [Dreissena polymorpha]
MKFQFELILSAVLFLLSAHAFTIEKRPESSLLLPDITPLGREKRASGNVVQFSMGNELSSSVDWKTVDIAKDDVCHNSRTRFPGGDIKKCPTAVASGQAVPANYRSTCPWYYTAEHDPTRFPTTIMQARSPCIYCIGSPINECVPVSQNTTVLQKSASPSPDGSYMFYERQVTVTVGFTCAGPRLAGNAATTKPTTNSTTKAPAEDIPWAK